MAVVRDCACYHGFKVLMWNPLEKWKVESANKGPDGV